MKRARLQLDATCRSVTLGGRQTVLQEKAWRVLSILLERAPEVVRRRDIIDEVWSGNHLTGDKALNQAIWSIRAALGEDPRAPAFVRTVPRVGYQWIQTGNALMGASAAQSMRSRLRLAAGIAVLVCAIAADTPVTTRAIANGSQAADAASGLVAARAFLVDRDIHVEFTNGCRAILKNASGAEIGRPVLSSDGAEVAVALYEATGCRLVTIELPSGARRDFGDCPAEITEESSHRAQPDKLRADVG